MSQAFSQIKFFCLLHQEPCYTTRAAPSLLCVQGTHALGQDFRSSKWEYCCACENFFARNDHDPPRDSCPACDRAILARYLCNKCETLSFAAEAPPPQRAFNFSDGVPQPSCPCCLTPPANTLEHDCEKWGAAYKTARADCSFCGNRTVPETTRLPEVFRSPVVFPSQFERPLDEYLQRMANVAQRAATVRPGVLVEQAGGVFWLVKHTDEAFIVFPSLARWNKAQDFSPFQTAFDCSRPDAGEVIISAPAVAYLSPDQRTWTLTQKGKLKIQPQQSIEPPTPPGPNPKLRPPPNDPPVSNNKRPAVLIGGIAAALLLALAIFFFWPSAKRQIIAKVKQGQIVTPAGSSAYDLYLSSNLSDSDRAEVRQAIKSLLEANGNEVIRKLVSENYAPSKSDCENTAKVFTWLDALAPQNSYRARKHYFQGRAAFDSEDLNGAENEFRQAMTLDAGWAVPVNHMGRVAVRRRDYSSARSWYESASAKDGNWSAPRSNLCVVAVENLRDYNLAQQACRSYIRLDQSKAAGYYFLGRALEEQGARCDALREYRTALDKASTNSNTGGINLDNLNRRIARLAGPCGG